MTECPHGRKIARKCDHVGIYRSINDKKIRYYCFAQLDNGTCPIAKSLKIDRRPKDAIVA